MPFKTWFHIEPANYTIMYYVELFTIHNKMDALGPYSVTTTEHATKPHSNEVQPRPTNDCKSTCAN